MSKIKYTITGSLPAPWEDFYTKAPGRLNATIITEGNRKLDDDTEAVDGWVTVFIAGNTLTLKQALRELAKINGVRPEDIVIEQEEFTQST